MKSEFINNLKKLRKEKNISQNSLAKYLSVSQQAVAKWETDKATPDPDTLKKIADYFDVSVDYLLGNTDIPHKQTIAGFHKHSPEEFTQEEMNKISEYMDFIISQREKEK